MQSCDFNIKYLQKLKMSCGLPFRAVPQISSFVFGFTEVESKFKIKWGRKIIIGLWEKDQRKILEY